QHAEHDEREVELTPDPAVHRLYPAEQRGQHEREEPDSDLEQRVRPTAVAPAGGTPSGPPASEREPTHVGSEHGAHGERGRAEDVTEEATPHDLVHEPGAAREQK